MAGELHRIRRGAYAAEAPQQRQDRERHRLLVEATVRQSSPEVVVSHISAAVLHELPTWNELLSTVHLTRGRGHGGYRSPTWRWRAGSGWKSWSTPWRPRRRTGVGSARRMVAFADGRSESVGESSSRVVLAQYGVPAPQPQYEVCDHGVFVARSDFGWEQFATLGEFDGKIKYGRLLKPGQSASDVVYAEKVREDALRDLGWQVVRWTWEDLFRPRLLVARLHRVFDRGRG